VRERALRALRRIVDEHPDDCVVVVSHGGTIRWISAEALGYDDYRSRRIRGLGNGAIVSVKADADGETVKLTDLHRLDGNTTDLDDPND
jgi:broad specificity phosphatase PhoE